MKSELPPTLAEDPSPRGTQADSDVGAIPRCCREYASRSSDTALKSTSTPGAASSGAVSGVGASSRLHFVVQMLAYPQTEQPIVIFDVSIVVGPEAALPG